MANKQIVPDTSTQTLYAGADGTLKFVPKVPNSQTTFDCTGYDNAVVMKFVARNGLNPGAGNTVTVTATSVGSSTGMLVGITSAQMVDEFTASPGGTNWDIQVIGTNSGADTALIAAGSINLKYNQAQLEYILT